MKRLLALVALLALALAVPAGALAGKSKNSGSKSKSRTMTYKGSFRAVGADGAYSDRKFGKAHLQDHRKKDKLHVHLRRLAPNTNYVFALYSAPKGTPVCEQGASGGTQETAFAPKVKRTNSAGNLNSKQRSKTFTADPAKTYFVLVSTTASDGSPDQPVACAELKGKKGKKGTSGSKQKGKGKSQGHAKSRAQGKAKGRGR